VTIEQRIDQVREKIERAGGRGVTLIAASKGVPRESIDEAYRCGLRDFGENYLQEALSKGCPVGATWHYIGRLQSNKINKVASSFQVVQTLDSIDKVARLSRAATHPIEVFLEVNIGEEQQKAGCLPGNVPEIAEIVYDLHNLKLTGLMTMGPENPNAEEARPYFIRMRKLIDSLAMPGVDKLSMGMTADYEVAIQEGATHVRIGSGIFGPRK
jgi:pyridoxal phosphate enzyme (YggS family)